jgi:hypothetical protein
MVYLGFTIENTVQTSLSSLAVLIYNMKNKSFSDNIVIAIKSHLLVS